MLYKANEPRRHRIPRARYRVSNWPEYDRALQQRGSLTVWVTPEALATADGKAPPRATAAGFSHCSRHQCASLRLRRRPGKSLSRRISQPTGSNRTASRMRVAEPGARCRAPVISPRSTKSAPPRPAPRRPSWGVFDPVRFEPVRAFRLHNRRRER